MRLDVGVRVFGTVQRKAQVVGAARNEAGLADAAVIGELAIPVRKTLPGVDRREMRWLQRSHEVLDRGQVGYARHSHLTVAPWASGEPLDAIVAVLTLTDTVVTEVAFGQP